jgi:ribosomal-protein-alanine N-acetyltransferase
MLADVAIRFATLLDAAEIAAMSRDTIEIGLPWNWRADRVARAIRDPETNVVVVGARGALVAFGIMSYPGDDAHLLLFAVRGSSRRQGIGSAVLQWLEAVACEAGAKRIGLESRMDNAAARSFYNEHGYSERALRRGMYGERVDGVRLEKWLRSDP